MRKPEVFLEFIRAGVARVHFDARRAGVVVPEKLRGDKQLAFDYGYNLSIPVEQLEVDGFGVRAILSFDRAPSVTFIPWSAVFAITDQRGVGKLWREDIPEDVEFEDREAAPERRMPN